MNAEGKLGYVDMEVWQRTIDWASKIVSLCDKLGAGRKHLRLVEQSESACISVPSNVAQGKRKILEEGISPVSVSEC